MTHHRACALALLFLSAAVLLGAQSASPQAPQPAQAASSGGEQDLSSQATDATASSAGDLQFTYDWERGEWVSVPLGFELGVVHPIAGQAFRFAISPQWNLKDIEGADKAKVMFRVTLLVPAN